MKLVSRALSPSCSNAAAAGDPTSATRLLLVTDDTFGTTADVALPRTQLQARKRRRLGHLRARHPRLHRLHRGRRTTAGPQQLRAYYRRTFHRLGPGRDGKSCVWTDVLGLHTADPDLVAGDAPRPHLTPTPRPGAVAAVGIRICPRTMIPLIESGISYPQHHAPGPPGALIDAIGSRDDNRPTVSPRADLALLPSKVANSRKPSSSWAGKAAILSSRCAPPVFQMWMTAQSPTDSHPRVVPLPDVQRARTALETELAQELSAAVEPLDDASPSRSSRWSAGPPF